MINSEDRNAGMSRNMTVSLLAATGPSLQVLTQRILLLFGSLHVRNPRATHETPRFPAASKAIPVPGGNSFWLAPA